jgi:ribonuclease J
VRSILELAQEHDKRVLALGAGIENCLRIASDLGLYKAPPGLLIDPREAALIDRKQLVVIATGSQGENRSALYRMSIGEYKLFALRDGDSVLFSSRTIPGNERVIQMMTAELERKGAKIITWRQAPNIHCSGHAYRDEVAEMLECLNPKFFAPIHGTFSHMNSNGLIPKEKTFLRAKTYLVESGDVLDFENGTLNYAERITPRVKFVDSDSSTLLTYEELRERLRIGELGCVFVSGVFSQKKNTWLSPPSVSTAGLPSDEFTNVESWQEICSAVVNSAVRNSLSTGSSSDEDVAEEARTHLRRHLFSLLGKKPVVQCHIHLV